MKKSVQSIIIVLFVFCLFLNAGFSQSHNLLPETEINYVIMFIRRDNPFEERLLNTRIHARNIQKIWKLIESDSEKVKGVRWGEIEINIVSEKGRDIKVYEIREDTELKNYLESILEGGVQKL